jgi:hypothetical protein
MRNKLIRSDKFVRRNNVTVFGTKHDLLVSSIPTCIKKKSLILEILTLCPAATEYCSSDIGIISRGKVLPKLTTQNRIVLYKFMNTCAVNVNTGSFIAKSFLIISPLFCQKRKPCFHVLPHILGGKEGH